MKTIILLLFAGLSCAGEPVKDTPEVIALKAEVEALKAKLYQKDLELNYAMQACAMPDLMAARLATVEAEKKAKQAAEKPKPVVP